MSNSPLKFTPSLAALFKIPTEGSERAETYLSRVDRAASYAFPFNLGALRVDYTDLPLVGYFAFERRAPAALDAVFDEHGDNTYVLMADGKRGLPDGFMLIMRCSTAAMTSAVAKVATFMRTPRIFMTGSRRHETGFIGLPLTAFFK